MLNNEDQAVTKTKLINPVSAANTAAATSSWVDTLGMEGNLLIVQHIGAVTGSIAGKIQDADDNSGTNSADVSGATFTSVSSANDLQTLSIPKRAVRRWIRYVGTVTTGPALTQVAMLGRTKNV